MGEHGRSLARLGEAEALARALDDRAQLGRVLAQMALVLRVTGDAEGAMTAGQQAFELAAALGDSALQAQAAHYLGQAYQSLGDFRRAVELLRRNVEAADREPGTLSTDVRLQSQAWLAQTLSALGAFAEGRRHGEEALRLATLEGRGGTPIIAHTALGELYLAKGDLEPAIRVLDPGLALCRTSSHWTNLRPIAAGLGFAYTLQGRLTEGRALLQEATSKDIHRVGCTVMPTNSHGSARSVVWRDAPMRPRTTHARRSTWHGSSGHEGTKRMRCTSWAPSMPMPSPPTPCRPKPTTRRPWPWPMNLACARSRPTATVASAPCMPPPVNGNKRALSCPPPLSCTAPWT